MWQGKFCGNKLYAFPNIFNSQSILNITHNTAQLNVKVHSLKKILPGEVCETFQLIPLFYENI